MITIPTNIFNAISIGLRYWFILLAGIMLYMIINISRREYKERKAALGEIQYYVGYLEIVGGMQEDIGVRIGITTENTVGSSRSADIVIQDPTVERAHALIYRRGNNVYLSPLNKGMTEINGRRAIKAHQIYTDDIISFGEIDMRVFLRDEVSGDEY